MTIKVTFLSMLLILLLPTQAQDISVQDFLGQWEYEYSQDSIEDKWVKVIEKDLEIILNHDNEIFQVDLTEQIEPFESSINAPLLLKDVLLTMRIFPVNANNNEIRFSFLQMPRGDENFKYIDRSRGDLKGEVVREGNFNILKLNNLGETEEYKIISMSKTNVVLLEIVSNTKHLFKRKQ